MGNRFTVSKTDSLYLFQLEVVNLLDVGSEG